MHAFLRIGRRLTVYLDVDVVPDDYSYDQREELHTPVV